MANVESAAKAAMAGASRKRGLSAAAGMTASFVNIFTASATAWNRPKGPTRLGPNRSWMNAAPRRSTQVSGITSAGKISGRQGDAQDDDHPVDEGHSVPFQAKSPFFRRRPPSRSFGSMSP